MRHFFLFIFLLSIFSFNSCGHRNGIVNEAKPFKINGKIDDTSIDTIVFKYAECGGEIWIKDTISVTSGTFTIESVTYPGNGVVFSINNEEVFFYLDPGEMQLFLKVDSLENSVLKGSQTQIDLETLKLQIKPLEDSFYKVRKQIYSEQSEQNKDFLINQKDSIGNLLDDTLIDFINSHPASYVSLGAIMDLFMSRRQNIDVLMGLFDGLSENVKVSCNGKLIHSYILQRQRALMANVPSLEALDKDGTLVKLSDFEGKYILIDFWASWCVPCIKGFPHLKALYSKYKDEGLVVISISVDNEKDEQKWLNAIEQNNIMGWIHILSCKNSGENNICDLYDSHSPIPLYIVIDNSGNIIKRWTGFDDSVAKEQDEIFKHIFENKE